MPHLEIHLLRSLVIKKPKIRLKLKKLCSISFPDTNRGPGRRSYASVEALPMLPSEANSTNTAAVQTKPCFKFDQEPYYLSADKSAFELVLHLTPRCTEESYTEGYRRLAHHERITLKVSAQYETEAGHNTHPIFETAFTCDDRARHSWIRHLVFEGSHPVRIEVKHQRLLTYSTGDTRWHFLIDDSLVARVRVIPVAAFDPESLFWSVCMYARYLRRPRPDEQPLESCLKTIFDLFRNELFAKKQQLLRLRLEDYSSPDRLTLELDRFEEWCRLVFRLIQTHLFQPILRTLEEVIPLLGGAQHLDILRYFQQTSAGNVDSIEADLSYEKVTCLLSSRSEWQVLFLLRSLDAHGSHLLASSFESTLENLPTWGDSHLQTIISRILLADFEAVQLVKSAIKLLRGEDIILREWKESMTPDRHTLLRPDELFSRVIFDADGQVLAKRTVRSTELKLAEKMLVWEDKLVLITKKQILASPISYKKSWNSRCISEALVLKYKDRPKYEYGYARFDYYLTHLDQTTPTFPTHNRNQGRCLVKTLHSYRCFRFQFLSLKFSHRRLQLEFEDKITHSRPGRPLQDKHQATHSVFVGASDGTTSFHFYSYGSVFKPNENFGTFLWLNEHFDGFHRAELDSCENVTFRSRLACPVPVELVAPKSKSHRIDYSSWVELMMFQTDPSELRKVLIYFYVQSVQIEPSKCGRGSHLVCKVNLLECSTLRCKSQDRFYPNYGEFFEYTICKVRLPQLLTPQDTMVFDPEQAPWAHSFIWKRLSVGVVGFRIGLCGGYSAFQRTSRGFGLLCHKRLSLSVGRYLRLKLSAASDGSTGAYWWKAARAPAVGHTVCRLLEIVVVL